MATLGRNSDESMEGLHRDVCPKLGVRKRSTPRVSSSTMLMLHRERQHRLNLARAPQSIRKPGPATLPIGNSRR